MCLFSIALIFTLWLSGIAKSIWFQVLFYLLISTCLIFRPIIIIIIIIIIIYSLGFFTSALADGLSLKFEWQ